MSDTPQTPTWREGMTLTEALRQAADDAQRDPESGAGPLLCDEAAEAIEALTKALRATLRLIDRGATHGISLAMLEEARAAREVLAKVEP